MRLRDVGQAIRRQSSRAPPLGGQPAHPPSASLTGRCGSTFHGRQDRPHARARPSPSRPAALSAWPPGFSPSRSFPVVLLAAVRSFACMKLFLHIRGFLLGGLLHAVFLPPLDVRPASSAMPLLRLSERSAMAGTLLAFAFDGDAPSPLIGPRRRPRRPPRLVFLRSIYVPRRAAPPRPSPRADAAPSSSRTGPVDHQLSRRRHPRPRRA